MMNEYDDYFEEDNYEPHSRAAERRKNEWKYANRRREILRNELTKPLHYYSKNTPESYADKRQIRRQKRQNDNFKNQINELFDEE